VKRYEFVKAPQRSPEWFELRKDAITATDVAVLMGLSPYKTPFRLFAEKTGRVGDQPAGEAAARGRILEDAVATYYEEERGVKLRKSNGIVRLKEHPWAMASLDRTVVGNPSAIVEIKTSTSRAWEIQPVPLLVIAQVQWQMFVTGAAYCDVVALLGGLVFRIERVASDEKYQADLFHAAVEFRKLLASDTPPSMKGADAGTFEELTPQASEAVVVADASLNGIAQRYAECAYQIGLLEGELETHKIAIKEAIAEKESIVGSGWFASWKQNKPRRAVDWKRLAEEESIPADTINAYTNESLGSRVFRFKQEDAK
jgi:putative phage-type endonuclease